jgi:hypothetical protein
LSRLGADRYGLHDEWQGDMKAPTFVQVRAATLFGAGLAGVAYETIVANAERPTLLILFAGMLGLPLFLKADEKSPRPPSAGHPEDDDAD